MKLPARPSPGTLIGLALGLGLVAWIGWATVVKYRETVDPEPARPQPPIPVQVEAVEPRSFSVHRSWRGNIDVDQRATLSAQLTATVLELPYREGERVSAGELVFRLDDAELQAEQERLKAVIERAGGELDNARRELERQRDLFARKLTPEKMLDDAAQRVDSLAAQKREAEANLTLIKTRLAYASGRAPFAGTVQRLHVQRGELARAGSPVLELIADDTLKAVVRVAQTDIDLVREGLPVTVAVPALDREQHGRVDRIYPLLDDGTRNATIAVLLPELAAGVRVGMAAVVHARLGAWDDALTLPAQAIHSEHGASWVYVYDGEKARRRIVQTGPGEDGRILIVAGLEPGEHVIVTADPRLSDGTRIRVEHGRSGS
ncbi:efflux RND transporter periplasmic adaptor subunit [Wenzhouxiangella sp. XN201]|uniref:efflux RND transporter periplasmic adaptor subunit n=1 Tax=Wenzhouxiangella sp. XN201 TaxID=2710755 RepID=UPI0013CBD8E6|nr:efflux RND transporter periplasmic adaptor subunit [Wenzhouxiangella sp. XN201]NEZ02705.1 efflux RND transporter periplasmic adaptor subunit [Wenzhouxiangella sp. XN201]